MEDSAAALLAAYERGERCPAKTAEVLRAVLVLRRKLRAAATLARERRGTTQVDRGYIGGTLPFALR